MSNEPTSAPPALSLVSAPEHDLGHRQLSTDVFSTLRQLERRMRTGRLEAVNIRDAQRLASLGLALHDRGGWRPTRDGLTYLSKHGDGDPSTSGA